MSFLKEPPHITVAVETPVSSSDVHVVANLTRWETLVGLACTEWGGWTSTPAAAELVLEDVRTCVQEAVDTDRLRDEPPLDRLPPEPRIRTRAMAAPDARDALRRATLFAAGRLDRLNEAAAAIYRRGRVRVGAAFALFTGWQMVLAQIGATQAYLIRGASVERLAAPPVVPACIAEPGWNTEVYPDRLSELQGSADAVQAAAERFGAGADLHPLMLLRALQPGDRVLLGGIAFLDDDILAAAGAAQEIGAAAQEVAARGSAPAVMLADIRER